MSRLQKKCLIGSAGFHLLLLVILMVGPAFLSSRTPPDDSQIITMIDLSKLTDGPTQTGGTPSQPPPVAPPQPAPPAPPAPTPPPQPAPVAPPEKTFIQKILEPEPPKVKAVEKIDKEAIDTSHEKVKVKAATNDSEASTKPKIEVATKLVKVSASASKTASTSEADVLARQRAVARARAEAVSHVLGDLKNNLSSGTEVFVPGQGAGTFVNYKEAVKIAYMEAWIPPTDAADDHAVTVVSVTIARDGTVVSARIKTPSGDAATDRSVAQTLRRVKFIAPFPEGATDAERTFVIKFDLTKKLLG